MKETGSVAAVITGGGPWSSWVFGVVVILAFVVCAVVSRSRGR